MQCALYIVIIQHCGRREANKKSKDPPTHLFVLIQISFAIRKPKKSKWCWLHFACRRILVYSITAETIGFKCVYKGIVRTCIVCQVHCVSSVALWPRYLVRQLRRYEAEWLCNYVFSSKVWASELIVNTSTSLFGPRSLDYFRKLAHFSDTHGCVRL